MLPIGANRPRPSLTIPLQVDLDELYPPSPKFLVFWHKSCCVFWLGIGENSSEVRECPNCKKSEVQALAGFSQFSDASKFLEHMISMDRETKLQSGNVRYIFDKINESEIISVGMNPPHLIVSRTDRLESAGRNGTFFKKWLFWDPDFSITHIQTHQAYINSVQSWNFQPNPIEWIIGQPVKTEKKKGVGQKGK